MSSTARAALVPTVYVGPFAHSLSLHELEIVEVGAIGVGGDGKIVFVEKEALGGEVARIGGSEGNGPDNGAAQGMKGLEVKYPEFFSGEYQVKKLSKGQFFFPGLVDTHIHAPQYPNSGLFGKTTLLDWLNTYTFPTESSFTSLPWAKTVYSRIVHRTLSHGTTTASYYATIHVPATNLLSSICHHLGQRAFIGRVCMDCNSPEYYQDASPASAITDTKATISYIKKIDPTYKLISPVVTPRFAVSCTGEMLSELGKLAATENLPIQTHVSENTDETNLVVNTLFPGSKSYTHVYDAAGLLTPRTILAHAVHITPEELDLIKETGTKISHCPVSNCALGSGLARVRKMLDSGVEVGLGTDVSGGYSISILEAARQALVVSKLVAQLEEDDRAKLSVAEALYLATLGGAKVMGLGERIGNFVVGKEWDAIAVLLPVVETIRESSGVAIPEDIDIHSYAAVDLLHPVLDKLDRGNVDIFEKQVGWEDRIAKWLFTGDDRNNEEVWVGGRRVYGKERGVEVEVELRN